MAKNYDDIGGVWRTIGGRRVFIKDGDDLATAMRKSGKFNLDDEYDRAHGAYKKEEDKINARKKELHREAIERENQERLRRLEEKLEGQNIGSKNFAEEVVNYKPKSDNEYHSAKEVLLSRFNRHYNDSDVNKNSFKERMGNVKVLEESEGYVLYSTKRDDDYTDVQIVSSYNPQSRFEKMPDIYYEQDYKGNIKKGSATVNWSAYGSQTPETTKEFIEKLTEAQKFAEKINKSTKYAK